MLQRLLRLLQNLDVRQAKRRAEAALRHTAMEKGCVGMFLGFFGMFFDFLDVLGFGVRAKSCKGTHFESLFKWRRKGSAFVSCIPYARILMS